MNSFSEIPILQREKQDSLSYQWDNAKRTYGEGIVIQQTLKGSVAFWEETGRREAGPGKALLFRYGEKTRYGLDADCSRPYILLYALITETPTVLSLYEDVKTNFGSVLRMEPKGEASTLLAHAHEARLRGGVRDRFADAETAFRLLLSLYREQIAERRGRDPVAYGKHLLDSQFRSPRNLKEWAEEIGLTREHFSREFHHRYGVTPAAHLRTLRLQHARLLLSNQSLTLEEVAAASGFASVKTFHRAFRSHFGKPPGRGR